MEFEFCPRCRSVLWDITEQDGKGAVINCSKKECGYYKSISRENPLVYERNLRQNKTSSILLNPYVDYDPTLEHFTNISCPNAECPSRVGAVAPDVIAIQLNKDNLLWMYKCIHCKTSWEQSSRIS